ncbi:MAG: hypothetical protein QOD95_2385 [Gammaproteobacteria bacterium]|nr:hypothetical protein [Gammaproteobacteria bacterium]
MLAVDEVLLARFLADDYRAEKVVAIALDGCAFMVRFIVFEKFVREVRQKFCNLLFLPTVLALKVVDSVFRTSKKGSNILGVTRDLSHLLPLQIPVGNFPITATDAFGTDAELQ